MSQQTSHTLTALSWPAGKQPSATVESALVFGVFFLAAATLTPAVNEAHYLTKAKHAWNASWCAGDFFLESPDAHLVINWTLGWLTCFFSLPAVAWIGRLIAWGLLAWAWRRASWALVPVPWGSSLSAAWFVFLIARADLAGEWVVGGVEAKALAYGLVLLSIEGLARGEWHRVWIWSGAAAAFHVLVGGWAVVTAGIAWCAEGRCRPALRRMLPSLVIGFALACWGVVPGVLLTQGKSPEVVNRASEIYVFWRLPHHLAIHKLPAKEFYGRVIDNGAVLALFGVLVWLVAKTPPLRRLSRMTCGATLVAGIGLLIGLALVDRPAWAAKVLRYYWFRYYDFALPLGVSMLLTAALARTLARSKAAGCCLLAVLLAPPVWHYQDVLRHRLRDSTAPANRTTKPESAWIEMCRWVATNTPPEARFLTPRMSQSFKWYAERPEVVTRKDIPQDAASLVEWARRMRDVHWLKEQGKWRRFSKLTDQKEARLLALARRYDAQYLVTGNRPRLKWKPVFANDAYAVYRLTELEQSRDSEK